MEEVSTKHLDVEEDLFNAIFAAGWMGHVDLDRDFVLAVEAYRAYWFEEREAQFDAGWEAAFESVAELVEDARGSLIAGEPF